MGKRDCATEHGCRLYTIVFSGLGSTLQVVSGSDRSASAQLFRKEAFCDINRAWSCN